MKVPHYKQTHDGYCLPACVRMVLSTYGLHYSEKKLAKLLGTNMGTPFSRLDRLTRLKVNVDRIDRTLEQLTAAPANGIFPIVSVRADDLSWTNFSGGHALVLVDTDGDQLAFHDPAHDIAPVWASVDEFMIAWIEHGKFAAFITLKT